ncbi:hypothetical protein RvY_08083 [Ramazzottius varieornatus]|uniref:CCDC113/CCDC96 coiled-coil domain-containing protein n=1 Tax=Ramazzottius varieornatus TaxID=947166 RepID=A0A1D1VDT1_RAMVA|nr:hypothetical protein RvY_08083 [Ramazzottius varieornatus]
MHPSSLSPQENPKISSSPSQTPKRARFIGFDDKEENLTDDELQSRIEKLTVETARTKEETAMFCAFLIRMHEVRYSVDLKAFPKMVHGKAHEPPNLAKIVRDLSIHRGKFLSYYPQSEVDRVAHDAEFVPHHQKDRPLFLTEKQKTLVCLQQRQFNFRHFISIQQELIDVHDQFESTVRDAEMYLDHIRELKEEFERKILDNTRNPQPNHGRLITSEKMMLWFRHLIIATESMRLKATLNRGANVKTMEAIRNHMEQPFEPLTKVDFFTLEIKCKMATEELQNHTKSFEKMKKQFNVITHKNVEISEGLSKWQEHLPHLHAQIKVKNAHIDCMKEETVTLNEEADKLEKSNDKLAKTIDVSLIPTVDSYVRIEKDVESCKHELRKWQTKYRLAVALHHLQPRSTPCPSTAIGTGTIVSSRRPGSLHATHLRPKTAASKMVLADQICF